MVYINYFKMSFSSPVFKTSLHDLQCLQTNRADGESLSLTQGMSGQSSMHTANAVSGSISLKTRVRPIPVSGIGRYLPVSVGIGIGRYLF